MPNLPFRNNVGDRSRKGTALASSLPFAINSMQIRLVKKVNSTGTLI